MRFREFPVGGRFSSCPTLLLSSRGCASRAPAFRGRAARWLPAYRRRPNRRVIAAPKLYFSDAGVVNRLARRACRSVTTTGSPACVRTGSVPSCGADARGSRRSPCRASRGRRRGRRPERRRASPSEWRVRPARRRGRADPRPRPRFACDCGPCAQNGEEPIGGQALPRGCCQIGPYRTEPAERPLLLPTRVRPSDSRRVILRIEPWPSVSEGVHFEAPPDRSLLLASLRRLAGGSS